MSGAPRILFEGAGLLVVDKPAGIAVIPGRDESPGASLREQLEALRGQKIFVVHRLDRDTSGVLVFALDAERHRLASLAFEHGEVEKRYLALVEGCFEMPRQIDVALVPARRGRMRPAAEGEEGKPSSTRLSPAKTFSQATLVEAVPLTGRTHQIRVHLRYAGHPLLVDHQYGRKQPLTARELGGEGDRVVLARTPLHAAQLRLPPLGAGPSQVFEAPLPGDFAEAIALLSSTR